MTKRVSNECRHTNFLENNFLLDASLFKDFPLWIDEHCMTIQYIVLDLVILSSRNGSNKHLIVECTSLVHDFPVVVKRIFISAENIVCRRNEQNFNSEFAVDFDVFIITGIPADDQTTTDVIDLENSDLIARSEHVDFVKLCSIFEINVT